ncbi:hypothetical protein HYT74_03690 [Candidatus Daviesbacteria bacterium]|nr:hypothetical protein [Candidatus Daviesbacteria bacterium]
MKFSSRKPTFEYLRKKWLLRHHTLQNKLWEKHGSAFKQLAIGSMGGLIFLSPPILQSPPPTKHLTFSRDDALDSFDRNVLLAEELGDNIPKEVRPLNPEEAINITQILSKNFGFKLVEGIDNIKLNRNYGLIGGEQHLYRYPGDNLYAHADTSYDWAKYSDAGIAPGLGAWGYFANSKKDFKEIDKQREKYYLAIQTFLVSGYAENVEKFRDFFKYRKMLVVNPKTGQSVVAVVADAGPADWTGKHLGGSPEVMDALGLAEGPRKGPVVYFFIDDPKDEIPLGPIKIKDELPGSFTTGYR